MSTEPQRLSPKLSKTDGGYLHWCPGCHMYHEFFVDKPAENTGALWSYNGNPLMPSFHPSMHITVGPYEDAEEPEWNMAKKTLCHYFLMDGVIQFLGDCEHVMKGMQVALPDLPEWKW